MPAMVQDVELAEATAYGVSNIDDYPQRVQDHSRALLALLGSSCTDTAGRWVRAQVDGGRQKDVFCVGMD